MEKVIDVVEDYKTVMFEEEVISTYINNGASKLILLLILYNRRFKTEDYKGLIKELISGIEGKFFMNSGFIEGG